MEKNDNDKGIMPVFQDSAMNRARSIKMQVVDGIKKVYETVKEGVDKTKEKISLELIKSDLMRTLSEYYDVSGAEITDLTIFKINNTDKTAVSAKVSNLCSKATGFILNADLEAEVFFFQPDLGSNYYPKLGINKINLKFLEFVNQDEMIHNFVKEKIHAIYKSYRLINPDYRFMRANNKLACELIIKDSNDPDICLLKAEIEPKQVQKTFNDLTVYDFELLLQPIVTLNKARFPSDKEIYRTIRKFKNLLRNQVYQYYNSAFDVPKKFAFHITSPVRKTEILPLNQASEIPVHIEFDCSSGLPGSLTPITVTTTFFYMLPVQFNKRSFFEKELKWTRRDPFVIGKVSD